MIIDTGIRCPDFQALNLFPFPVSTDYQEIYNQSGYSGPTKSTKTSVYSGFSGMFGPGTFYPGSGNLDQFSRAYWCVKSWLLTVKLYRVQDAGMIHCEAPFIDPDLALLFPPLDLFSFCTIGGFGGQLGSLTTAEIFTKTLTLQDYCSYTSTGYGLNLLGVCPPVGKPSSANGTCVPINPIQKFNDLFCRQSYFSWMPSDQDMIYFESGNFTGINSPYRYDFTQFRIMSDPPLPPYDCGNLPFSFEPANSLFSLALMNPDILAHKYACIRGTSGEMPTLQDDYPFGYCGRSGEALTDQWGQITGYGINPKPSGINTPCLLDVSDGAGSFISSTGILGQPFFPFVYFQLRLKNNVPVVTEDSCPINDTITTVLARDNQQLCGSFTIYDQPLSGNNAIAGRPARQIMQIPLFASTTSQSLFAEVSIEPSTYWTTTGQEAIY